MKWTDVEENQLGSGDKVLFETEFVKEKVNMFFK